MTLRPEVNSGIVRAVTENHLDNNLPLKLYYYGDVFRYDRPQKDRYREFTQFGFEFIGNSEPIVDAEMLSLAYDIYKRLGINNITLRLNSLGSLDDINKYRLKLIDYFSEYIEEMCDDCKNRLLNNPLRILDCKKEFDRQIIQNAPKLLEYISKESRGRFENVIKLLQERNIPFSVDNDFVRGIDYQNDTIFEIVNNDGCLGNQNDMCGGGRYDNLYKHLANKNIPAFGFDFGLERMIKSIKSQNHSYFGDNSIDIYFVCFSKEDMNYCYNICKGLRKNGIRVEYDLNNRPYRTQLKQADKFNPKFTGFIGENERICDKINVRNNSDGSKYYLDPEEIIIAITGYEDDKERVKVKKYGSK